MPVRRATDTINTMREILVATDGSAAARAALEEALALARETGSAVVVLTVWRALQGDFGLAYPSTAVLADILDAERRHAEATLEDAAARAAEMGVEVVTRLATGDPAETVCAYAGEIQAKLVAVGTRGHSSVASLLLGSVSNAVIRHAPCPVLVVRDPGRPAARAASGADRRPRLAPRRGNETRDARRRRRPCLELAENDRRPELLQRTGDQPGVEGAHNPGIALRELTEGTTVHHERVGSLVRSEPATTKKSGDTADACLLVRFSSGLETVDHHTTPASSCRLGDRGAVVEMARAPTPAKRRGARAPLLRQREPR